MKAKEVYVLLNTEVDGTLLLSPPQVTEQNRTFNCTTSSVIRLSPNLKYSEVSYPRRLSVGTLGVNIVILCN